MSQQSTDLYDQLDALHAVTELTKAAARHGAVRVPSWSFYDTGFISGTIYMDRGPVPSDLGPWMLAIGQAVNVMHFTFETDSGLKRSDIMGFTYMGLKVELGVTYPCTAEQAAEVRS